MCPRVNQKIVLCGFATTLCIPESPESRLWPSLFKLVLLGTASIALSMTMCPLECTGNDKLGRIRSEVRQPTVQSGQYQTPRQAKSKPDPHRSAPKKSAPQNPTRKTSAEAGKLASIKSSVRANRRSTPTEDHDHGNHQGSRHSRPGRYRASPRRSFPRPRASRALFYPRQTVIVSPPPAIQYNTYLHSSVPCVEDGWIGCVSECQVTEWNPPFTPVVPSPSVVATTVPTLTTPDADTVLPCNDGHAAIGYDWFSSTDSRLWANLGSDFDGLTIGSFGLLAQQAKGLGLDISLSTLRESGVDWRDNLWLGDANLVYQVVRTPRTKVRLGMGVNWLGDRWGSEAGVNLTAGLDFRLGRHWMITGESDLGTLGDADLWHAKLALHRQQESVDWVVGYEHYTIGNADIGSVFTGIGIRF